MMLLLRLASPSVAKGLPQVTPKLHEGTVALLCCSHQFENKKSKFKSNGDGFYFLRLNFDFVPCRTERTSE
jgi:hypothetical protein